MKEKINTINDDSRCGQEIAHQNITFEDMQARAIRFAKGRNWHPLSPEDNAKSIIIEAAELLEHFQWDITNKKYGLNTKNKKNRGEIALELADILIYCIHFAHNMDINLPSATYEKLNKLEIKYPIEEFKNGHNEDFYRSQKKKYRKVKE